MTATSVFFFVHTTVFITCPVGNFMCEEEERRKTKSIYEAENETVEKATESKPDEAGEGNGKELVVECLKLRCAWYDVTTDNTNDIH